MDFLDLNAPKKKDDSLGVGIDDGVSSADDFYSGDFDFSTPKKSSAPQNTYEETTYGSAPVYQSSGMTRPSDYQNTYSSGTETRDSAYNYGRSMQNTYSVDSFGSQVQNTYSGTSFGAGGQNTYQTGSFTNNSQNAVSGNGGNNNTGYTESQLYRDAASTEFHILGELDKIEKSITAAEWILIGMGVILSVALIISALLGSISPISCIFTAVDIGICMGLAFGVGRKNKVCAVLAVVYSILRAVVTLLSDFLTIATGGTVRRMGRRLVSRIGIVITFIAAQQKIKRFHELKARYEFDPNEKISRYFVKEPLTFKFKYLIMIIAVAIGLVASVVSIGKVATEVGSAVSSYTQSADMSNWERVNIGEGEGVSILMPTTPNKTVSGESTTYSAGGATTYVIARHGDGIVKGYTQKQKEAIAQKLLDETIYTEIHSETGEDSNGYYAYRVFKVEEDGDSAIMCIKVMILDEDVVLINYSLVGDDYSGSVKEEAEEFFSKVYRTY